MAALQVAGKIASANSALKDRVSNAQFSNVDTNLFLKAALVFLSTKEARLKTRLNESFKKNIWFKKTTR